jgi:hypothetical protein
METPALTVSPEKLLYDQWRSANNIDPITGQNTINLGPPLPLHQISPNIPRYQQGSSQDGRDDVYTFPPYSGTVLFLFFNRKIKNHHFKLCFTNIKKKF